MFCQSIQEIEEYSVVNNSAIRPLFFLMHQYKLSKDKITTVYD